MSQSAYSQPSKVELWGGMECTINRVGDQYRDQLSETGHYDRPGDIDLIASLNIKSLRYPILWERHEYLEGQVIDWTFAKKGLDRLASRNIKPIVGLLHHGSGPRFTSLVDPLFATKFCDYARKVAQQFPEIECYSLINEPLTTARFSGLYGFWYPHHKDAFQFVTMLMNQLKGVVLAMKAIRQINPNAKLIQTEDLTKVHSTEVLKYQAYFENERRWLSFDLLCGKVTTEHLLWDYLTSLGIKVDSLQFFIDNPCPPDTLGLNYYVTSERYLDDQIAHYPESMVGGNGVHRYVDLEACRSNTCVGIEVLLEEVWLRFKIPLAITEVHLGCSREEQMRWFKEVWDGALASAEKFDVRAVTVWSIFGAFDWDSLGTKVNGHYESGVFDVSGPVRHTLLASMITALGKNRSYDHPLLEQKGWWHQRGKLSKSARHLLIIGDAGPLTQGFVKVCDQRGILIHLIDENIDLENIFDIFSFVARTKPWGIINTIQSSTVSEGIPLHNVNVHQAIVSKNIASIAELQKVPLMCFPLEEGDFEYSEDISEEPRILKSGKRSYRNFDEEALIAAANANALIIRKTNSFSPWERADFTFKIVEALKGGDLVKVPVNIQITPTYLPHVINQSLDLFIDQECGTWLLAHDNPKLSWSEFAFELARRGGYSDHQLIPVTTENDQADINLNQNTRQVRVSSMPKLSDAINEYLFHVNE